MYLRRNANVPCRYDLGFTAEDKEGMPTMGKRIASIWFYRLSSETETTHRLTPWLPPGSPEYQYDLTVFGLPGAVCDNVSGKDKCFDRLERRGLSSDELRQMLRELNFIFENVCSPAELLLER